MECTCTSRTSSVRPYHSNPLYISIVAHQHHIYRQMCRGWGAHTDRILCILSRLKHDRPTSLGTSIDADVDVRTDDGTRMAEEVLDILPAGLVGQLWVCDASVTPSNSLLVSGEV